MTIAKKKMQPYPVALITGAARRIGADLTRALHAEGYCVVIHHFQSARAAQALAEDLNAHRPNSAVCIQADLRDQEQLIALATKAENQWQRCDLLVNSASSFYPTPLGTTTDEQWEDLIGSNVKAPFFLAQALAPALKQARGSIINIADIYAFAPLDAHTVYCIAKAGNTMLTKSLAKELAPNVTVNGIAPGAILWPEDKNKNQIENLERLKTIPLKKLGGTSSIIDTLLFLIKKPSYITGEIITVDGGKTLVNH